MYFFYINFCIACFLCGASSAHAAKCDVDLRPKSVIELTQADVTLELYPDQPSAPSQTAPGSIRDRASKKNGEYTLDLTDKTIVIRRGTDVIVLQELLDHVYESDFIGRNPDGPLSYFSLSDKGELRVYLDSNEYSAVVLHSGKDATSPMTAAHYSRRHQRLYVGYEDGTAYSICLGGPSCRVDSIQVEPTTKGRVKNFKEDSKSGAITAHGSEEQKSDLPTHIARPTLAAAAAEPIDPELPAATTQRRGVISQVSRTEFAGLEYADITSLASTKVVESEEYWAIDPTGRSGQRYFIVSHRKSGRIVRKILPLWEGKDLRYDLLGFSRDSTELFYAIRYSQWLAYDMLNYIRLVAINVADGSISRQKEIHLSGPYGGAYYYSTLLLAETPASGLQIRLQPPRWDALYSAEPRDRYDPPILQLSLATMASETVAVPHGVLDDIDTPLPRGRREDLQFNWDGTRFARCSGSKLLLFDQNYKQLGTVDLSGINHSQNLARDEPWKLIAIYGEEKPVFYVQTNLTFGGFPNDYMVTLDASGHVISRDFSDHHAGLYIQDTSPDGLYLARVTGRKLEIIRTFAADGTKPIAEINLDLHSRVGQIFWSKFNPHRILLLPGAAGIRSKDPAIEINVDI